MKRAPAADRQLSFHSDLENRAEGMDSCAVPVPVMITEALCTKGPVLVNARANDSTPLHMSHLPVGGGQHCIRVKSRVCEETPTKTGDRIRRRITVLDRANVTISGDLKRALRAEGVADGLTSLPLGEQTFITRQVDDTVEPETREKRIQEAVQAALERSERKG